MYIILFWLISRSKIQLRVGRSPRPVRKPKVPLHKHPQDEVVAQMRSCSARQAAARCTIRFISWTSMSCVFSMRSDGTRPKADTTAAGMSAKLAARTSVEGSAGHVQFCLTMGSSEPEALDCICGFAQNIYCSKPDLLESLHKDRRHPPQRHAVQ